MTGDSISVLILNEIGRIEDVNNHSFTLAHRYQDWLAKTKLPELRKFVMIYRISGGIRLYSVPTINNMRQLKTTFLWIATLALSDLD
jgi:hypothetical protein